MNARAEIRWASASVAAPVWTRTLLKSAPKADSIGPRAAPSSGRPPRSSRWSERSSSAASAPPSEPTCTAARRIRPPAGESTAVGVVGRFKLANARMTSSAASSASRSSGSLAAPTRNAERCRVTLGVPPRSGRRSVSGRWADRSHANSIISAHVLAPDAEREAKPPGLRSANRHVLAVGPARPSSALTPPPLARPRRPHRRARREPPTRAVRR